MKDPFLILQLQRLGDILLTFPLVIDLQKTNPGTPIWMVAESHFFNELMPVAPNITFFTPSHLPELAKNKYSAIYNFSSRNDAAEICAKTDAERKFGKLKTKKGAYISGYWQLFRTALTANNRHNTFHWADLNRLDNGAPLNPVTTLHKPPQNGQIGIFIGASERAKRPKREFWIELVKSLMRRHVQPVLLGGPAEKAEGEEIAARTGISTNFCGKTSLAQLSAILRSLDLLITSDTGPMHLANWLGCRVLNLSLGNVNAHETGPINPGQYILHANISCYGCWNCVRGSLLCHKAFNPVAIARTALAVLREEEEAIAASIPPGLVCRKSGIEPSTGLISLNNISGKNEDLQALLGRFWRNAFLHFFDGNPWELRQSAQILAQKYPAIIGHMQANFGKMLAYLNMAIKKGADPVNNFWQSQPFHSRLYAGYMHMLLQNEDYSRSAIGRQVNHIAELRENFTSLI